MVDCDRFAFDGQAVLTLRVAYLRLYTLGTTTSLAV